MKLSKDSPTLKTTLFLAALVVVLAGIKAASAILVPFLLSVFIAIVCNPLVVGLTRRRVPKGLAITLIMVLIILLGMWLANLVGGSVQDFSRNLPAYRQQLNEQFHWVVTQLAALNFPVTSDQLLTQFDPGKAMSMATQVINSLGGVMANLFLILLTVVFMLVEASSLPKKIHFALDDPDMRLAQIDRFLGSVNQYLAIKTLVSLGTGVIVSFSLWAIGLDYFMLWGVLAFLFNYVPNIGSIIAAVPAVLLALIQLGPLWAGITGGMYVAVNLVMGNVIEPRFMGRGLGLSTLVVFLSLIFWGWLLGTVGMLLSVPLTMIVKIGLESNNSSQWFALLLGGDPQPQSQPMAVSRGENVAEQGRE